MMGDEPILPGISEREIAIRRRVHRLAEFYRHVGLYVVMIGAMWAFNAWTEMAAGALPKHWYSWWAIWPTFGWGIGLISHGLSVAPFWSFFSQDWEDKKVKQLMERDRV